MTELSSSASAPGTRTRRILAIASALMVAIAWVLVVIEAVLYRGEFILTTVAEAVAAVITLRRAWIVGFSGRHKDLALTRRPWRWLTLGVIVIAVILYLPSTAGQRQFLGITAASIMFVGYMSLVLFVETPKRPDDAPIQ
ncbi:MULTISPECIES: hypothetical protein [Arthrobacter]|uniref:Uncharacterized protein n=1 Tax=Arthrobacter terricola TaxID=2547396 RepID=A0A4R5KDJ4_9MICC|nr:MULTISPECIES: hypothetical protein [Arthrobacter]MBT8161733.1 hypothetical protein [Arthrobacter sp. GN70]TDF92695.1 hypothetical protein E1809_17770 [Arthrobacter terricola]